MKTYFKLMTIATVLSGFVMTTNAQSIGTGPEADPYWRQFVPHQNTFQFAPVTGGIERDVYWSQFLPKELASAPTDNAEVRLAGGPQTDPYWSLFVPSRDVAVAAQAPTGPQLGIETISGR